MAGKPNPLLEASAKLKAADAQAYVITGSAKESDTIEEQGRERVYKGRKSARETGRVVQVM